MKANKDKFIVIQQWMITELGLKGSELIAYALIYGLTIHESDYHGTADYLSTWLGIFPKKCYRVLSTLCERGLLLKTMYSRTCIHYEAVLDSSIMEPCSSQTELNSSETEPGSSKREPNNITDNISDNIKIEEKQPAVGGLFANEPEFQPITVTKPRKTSEKLCIFENSKYVDFELFKAEFNKPEFANIDLVYYYHVVADWSASKGTKRRDWIATARNFMRGDNEKGKLHTLNKQGVTLEADAMEYLQMMSE